MPKGKYKIAPEVREQIIKRLKEQGASVSELAEEHGISSQTIYGWLGKGVTAPPSVLEVSRLKRENQTLMEIIGRLTVKLSLMGKKNSDW
jgi:transposase-like protein